MYAEKQYHKKIAFGKKDYTLMTLIAVCLVMYVGLQFMRAVWFFKYGKETAPALFQSDVMSLFAFPADGGKILQRPWTILSYMFVHDNVWKIFANTLWLWCFGYIMQDLTGNKKIVPVFIYGGLAGALGFFLSYNFMGSLHSGLGSASVLGASSGVMAVAVATTLISPTYKIFPMISGGIPLWVLTAIYVISDLTTVPISDTGNLVAHVSGVVAGFLFIWFLRMGYDWSEWMSNFFDWITNLFNPHKPKKGKTIREELFYKASTEPYKKTANVTQQRIDEILDKISQFGYQSLTEEEKELLNRAKEL